MSPMKGRSPPGAVPSLPHNGRLEIAPHDLGSHGVMHPMVQYLSLAGGSLISMLRDSLCPLVLAVAGIPASPSLPHQSCVSQLSGVAPAACAMAAGGGAELSPRRLAQQPGL